MSLANVVAAGVEPEIGVAVLLAVLLAVVEDSFEHIRDGAVVATAVTGRQDDNITIPGLPGISFPGVCVFGDLPVPLGLCLEVARLGRVVVGDGGYDGLCGRIVAVIVDRHIAVEAEEDDEDGDDGNSEYD